MVKGVLDNKQNKTQNVKKSKKGICVSKIFGWFPADIGQVRFSDQSKLEGSADDKMNVTQKLKFISENILGRGENAGYQHFLLFP